MDGDSNLGAASLDSSLGVSNSNSPAATTPEIPDTSPEKYDLGSKPAYIAADINAQQSGERSIFDRATDVVTKGVPLVGASVINSFANTAIELGNWTGVTDGVQKWSIENEFGDQSDTTNYYQHNAVPIEVTGLLAGSLIPGLGATKFLKLATATGRFSSEFSAATGLLSGIQDSAIKDAIGESVGNSAGTSLFGGQLLAKSKAIAIGVGDNALQGGVYQLATLATMKASPLTDSNTIHQNVEDVVNSALGFGVLGGGINAFQTLGNIKTAVTKLDLISKEAELVGTKGLGNITPGDRIVGLLDQQKGFKAQQEAGNFTDALSQRKAEQADNVVIRQLNIHFDALASQDSDVADAFKSFALKQAQNIPIDTTTGTADLSSFAEQFGQLAKVGRLDDTRIVSPATNAFYVNPKVDLSSLVATAGQDGTLNATDHLPLITSSILNSDNQLAKAIVLKNPGVNPVIGHALENDDNSLVALSGVPGTADLPSITPKYKNTQDAFSKGVDIFIDKNGGTHLNLTQDSALLQVPRPGEGRILSTKEREIYNATGALPATSKPLNTSALFLNVKDGTINGEAPLAVVGDIGTTKFQPNGLQITPPRGPTINYKFKAGNGEEFNPSSPIQANAEYVWNALRGVQDGDTIHPENLPQLEALHTALLKDEALNTEAEEPLTDRLGISFSDGSQVPDNSADLFQHIQQVKMEKIIDYLSQDKPADEIAQLTNVDPKVISSGGTGKLSNSDWMIPADQHQSINTVRLAYDISNKNGILPENTLRGMQAVNYRYQLATQANTDATGKYLNWLYGGDGTKAATALSAMKVTAAASDAVLTGAGEGAVFSANGGYGTAAQQVERVGRNFADLQTLRHTAVNEALAPSLVKIRNNPEAAAELGAFTFAQRSSAERYVFLNKDLADKYNIPENTAVLEGSITYKKGVQSDWSPDYKPEGYNNGGQAEGTGLKTYYTLSPEVTAVQQAHAALLASRNDVRDNWRWAQGLDKKNYNPEALYPPTFDTSRTPFFAFVKQREGTALGGDRGTHIMVARSADDLRSKISLLPSDYQAITKENIAEFKKAQGEYDFNRNFTNTKVQSDLQSKGLLTGFVPEQRAENLINDFVQFHQRQETQLLRDYTELHNADTFAKLQAMGERYVSTGNARFGSSGTKYNPNLAPDNPYSSYLRTALGVSSKDNYPFWNQAQEKIEAFGNTAFNLAQSMLGKVQKGIVTPEQSDKILARFGIGNPYGEAMDSLAKNRAYYGGIANRLPDANIFSKVIGTANAVLHKTVIAMDPIQQLVHAVTLPIMTALEHGPVTKDLMKLASTDLPQAAGAAPIQVPTFMRSMYNGIKDWFNHDAADPEFKALVDPKNPALGIPRDQRYQMQAAINELTVPPVGSDGSKSVWLQKISNAAALGEKLSGTKLVNEFNHYMAANVGFQLAKAKGLAGQDLIDDVSTFTNRVLGNLTAGQRGALFHGPVGQAIGLFQSYQFNLMQQVFRHVEEGNTKAIALAAGLQSTIFGLSSLPGFKPLNTLIQQYQGNSSADDLYTEAVKNLGPTFGNWALYGGLTGLTGAALYSRGDINPRRPTLIPTNPMDIPSVSAAIRVAQNVAQLGKNIANGGSVPASVMFALEHNSLSRPLTGMIEMMQGYSTDEKGNLLSSNPNSTMGMSDYASIANMSRLLGARPLDESIALQQLQNYNVNKQATAARLEELGQAFKTQVYANDNATPQTAADFAGKYAAAGGRVEDFNKWMTEQTNRAHTPAADAVAKRFGSDPRAMNSMIRMGGQPLPAYTPQVQSLQTPDTSNGDTGSQ